MFTSHVSRALSVVGPCTYCTWSASTCLFCSYYTE
uniref:Uncharacterized protein n=1 Tax=Anguilla anguilla TaxID=7936 RepID=A0A0E9PSS3_ANGAN